MSLGRIVFLSAVIAAFASAAFGGIRYEFQQIKRSSDARDQPTVLIGKAILDGENSRVEYLEGSTVGAGHYILTTNGGKTTSIVDPANKTYISQDATAFSPRLRNLDIEVRNFAWNSDMLGSGPEIAGYPTEHHRIALAYDLILTIGPLEMTQNIETTIDKYTTLAFGDVGSAFFRGDLPSTGNPSVDQIIQAEALNTPGIPLRQTVRITSTVDESKLPVNSQIQLDRQRVQTSEMTVTSIERIGVKPGVFQIPMTYQKVERGLPTTPIGQLNPTTEIIEPK